MTIREKMDEILFNEPDYADSGEFHIDGRQCGVLQNKKDGRIRKISKSKDDIDDENNPVTTDTIYDDLGEFFKDYPPSPQHSK